MPKLYHQPGAGWIVPGQQDKAAVRVDVPNSPGELADWLNDRAVSIVAGVTAFDTHQDEPTAEPIEEIRGAAGDPARCSSCSSLLSLTKAGALATAGSADLTALEEWLGTINADRLFLLQRAAEAVKARAAELGAKLDQAGSTVQ